MKKTIITLFCLLLVGVLQGQTIITDLYGFRLGQYRETAVNEFGKPYRQDKFKDGFEYEIFLLKPDTSLYIIFEYAAGRTDIVWSIQISGDDTMTDIGFKGLKLGLGKGKVEKILGRPDYKTNLGEFGEKWSYESTNYSIEIAKNGKLSSIKLTDNYAGAEPDLSKIPKFETVVKRLNSNKNADIALVLAPGLEIYYKNQVFYFGKSLKTEIESDFSKIFQTIREIRVGLDKIDPHDENSYEETMRFVLGQNMKHVVKINTGHPIKEIVFDYVNGEYLIWEINAEN